MKTIVYTNDKGGVTIVAPNPNLDIEYVKAKDTPEHSIIIDTDDITVSDYWFDAWELDDNIVSVNFTKAQEITRTRLRNERIPLLAAQDILFQRALETNADTTSIVIEKNRLRDITNLVDSASTLDELRSLNCG
jgi:hypothetical protein